MSTLELFLAMIIVLQGFYLLGITTGIFFYYVINIRRTRKKIKEFEKEAHLSFPNLRRASSRMLKIHIITIAVSYLIMVSCTMFTVYHHPYDFSSGYYWFVAIAYMLGDVSLFKMFVIQRDKYNDYELSDKKGSEILEHLK